MQFMAGYGERDITPPLGTELTGFGFYLERRAEALLDPLKARALFLRNTGGNSLVIVVCDLIGLSISFSDAFRKKIAADYRMAPEQVFLNCTHTHSGPGTEYLEGLGEINADYVSSLPGALEAAVRMAYEDLASARFGVQSRIVEPIGYNRRNDSFDPLDSRLGVALFRRADCDILLLNYACHAVTLGPSAQISADWPGAAIRTIEERGARAIVMQGFCGDIDPVVYMNGRGGTPRDVEFCGEMLAARAVCVVEGISVESDPILSSSECRIALPLSVPSIEAITEDERAWCESYGDKWPNARRFIRRWGEQARRERDRMAADSFLHNAPIQALAIGGMRILGFPGEVFCEYGLRLRREIPLLMPVGYAGGYAGYLPTCEAFEDKEDYAAYTAPRFFALFPFTADLEELLVEAAGRAISGCSDD